MARNAPVVVKKPKALTAEEERRKVILERTKTYVIDKSIVLPPGISRHEVTGLFQRRLESRRDNSMNLNGNLKHIIHFIHRATQTEFVLCYVARLKGVKRPLQAFKKALGMKSLPPSGFVRNKLTKSTLEPELKFIREFIPPFLTEDTDRKTRKANMESFASYFFVFTRPNKGDLPPFVSIGAPTSSGRKNSRSPEEEEEGAQNEEEGEEEEEREEEGKGGGVQGHSCAQQEFDFTLSRPNLQISSMFSGY